MLGIRSNLVQKDHNLEFTLRLNLSVNVGTGVFRWLLLLLAYKHDSFLVLMFYNCYIIVNITKYKRVMSSSTIRVLSS